MLTTTTPIIDLGNIQRGSIVPFSFNITNNSTSIINLTTKVTCGCTKPDLDTTLMQPLSMQFGKGTFRAPNGPGAIHHKEIYVSANTGETITIKLKGNVL